MIDYGRIKSTVRPEAIEIDEYSVYVNADIQEISVPQEDGSSTVEYEFHQVRYVKDEYIKKLVAEGAENNNLMNTILGVKNG